MESASEAAGIASVPAQPRLMRSALTVLAYVAVSAAGALSYVFMKYPGWVIFGGDPPGLLYAVVGGPAVGLAVGMLLVRRRPRRVLAGALGLLLGLPVSVGLFWLITLFLSWWLCCLTFDG